MLDKPDKTRQLLVMLKAALPFEVTLTPELIAALARQQKPIAVKSTETVSDISLSEAPGEKAEEAEPWEIMKHGASIELPCNRVAV